MINKKDSEYQTTVYITIKRIQSCKNKEASKNNNKNWCASRVLVVGSSNELSRLPFPSKQLQVPIASEEARLPLPWIPLDVSEPTAYIALATFFPWRSI